MMRQKYGGSGQECYSDERRARTTTKPRTRGTRVTIRTTAAVTTKTIPMIRKTRTPVTRTRATRTTKAPTITTAQTRTALKY